MGTMGQEPSSPIGQACRAFCAGRDYSVLDQESIQSRLHLPADHQFSRAESGLVRQLYDCPDVAVGKDGLPLPFRGCDPSRSREKEPDWSDSQGRRL